MILIVVLILICIPTTVGVFYLWQKRHREELLGQSFPKKWKQFLLKRLKQYRYLPKDLRQQLHGLINVFLDEKEFIGCGGLEITDEMRVTVAGQACMLLLNRETSYYNDLHTIYIYPHTYVKNDVEAFDGEIVEESTFACQGESWQNGPVVLTWDNILHGASDMNDGHNVVFHEFAHQLDQESGSQNGTPILEQTTQYLAWGRVLSGEYEELCEQAASHKRTVMDDYGTTNPAEFFAVATETFFEKPRQLNLKHPELYEVLKRYYKLDPLSWG